MNSIEKGTIYLPPRPRKRNPRHKRVVKPGDVDPEIVKRHALCARLVPQTLDGVQLLQRGVPGAEDEAEDEDEGDDGERLARVLDHGGPRFVELGLPVRAVDDVCRDEGAHDAEDGDADSRRDEELRSAAPFVRVDGAEDGAGEGDDVLHAVEEETAVVARDARALQHGGVVVRDGAVAGPLPEEGHGEHDHGAVALLAAVEELAVVPPSLVGARDGDVLDHLLVLELDDGRVAAAFAVVLGHGVECLLVAVVGDEPARGFGEERGAEQYDAGEDHLEPDGDTPGHGAGHGGSTVGNESTWYPSYEPEGIENPREHTTVGGMGHLGGISRPGGGCNGDTEPEDEASAHEASEGCAGSLDAGTDDDDETSQEHSPFAALDVGGRTGNERANQVADGVDGVDDTGRRRSFVDVEAEIASVLRVAVDGAHQRPVVTVDAGVERRDQQTQVKLHG